MLEINSDNLRILLLDGLNFFEFKAAADYKEKSFLFHEAKRFCHLYKSTEIPTHEILALPKKPFSYWCDENENLFYYPPDRKLIGKFLTNRVCAKIRLINILNLKSNFWSGLS